MTYQPGDDVLIDFHGLEHRAEVLNHRGSWVLAVMIPDPVWDYGRASAQIDPSRQTVCVRDRHVRRIESGS